MDKITTDIYNATSEYNLAKKIAREKIVSSLNEIFKAFFDQNPLIKIIGWVQCTIHYDGYLVYGIQNLAFSKNENDINKPPINYTEITKPKDWVFTQACAGEEWAKQEVAEWENIHTEYGDDACKQTEENCEKLAQSIGDIEDCLLEIFGDGTLVVVTRDGINTQEYDND